MFHWFADGEDDRDELAFRSEESIYGGAKLSAPLRRECAETGVVEDKVELLLGLIREQICQDKATPTVQLLFNKRPS